MTIEEKAKAYDEALKVLHKYDGANIMFSQSLKEEMFPELKESEDERIFEEIYKDLHTYYMMQRDKFVLTDIKEIWDDKWSKAKAWLEKQGKNNMGISETTKQKLEDNLNKALEKETPESLGKFFDEQKPYGQREECLDCQFNYAGECKGSCAMKRGEQILANSAKTCKDEQKPAWSEEDERKLELLRALIEDTKGDAASYSTMFIEMEELDNWLKFLKERILPQPKQEWSEEYEKRIKNIEESLLAYKIIVMDNDMELANYIEKDIEWLKSLKDRYTWKPSDEQMDALHYVTNFDYGGHKATLVSLYEQLKKLKA